MSKNSLEQFIRDNREDFDSEVPGDHVWENIRHSGVPPQQPGLSSKKEPAQPGPATAGRVIRTGVFRWTAAAAILLLITGSLVFFIHSRKSAGDLAVQTDPDKTTPGKTPASVNPSVSPSITPSVTAPGATAPVTVTKDTAGAKDTGSPSDPIARIPRKTAPLATATEPKKQNKNAAPINKSNTQPTDALADYQEEMGHYTRLVELKHKELKRIEKDEPLLYKQFAGDVNKLDNVYHSLEKKLSTNPNREQLLEAMVQNLQLQMELLNHQLKIIRQINHSKKTAYDNAYKTT